MKESKRGKVGSKGGKLVRGIGINDADYPVFLRLPDGKVWQCPIYRSWANILTRCTSEEGKYSYDYSENHNEWYIGITLCDEWVHFMKFREWSLERNWEGNHVDKDIIGNGTHYSPETCDYVPAVINMILHRKTKGSEYLWGVCKQGKRFSATVMCEGEIYASKSFRDEFSAHQFYQKNKVEVIRYMAEKYLFNGRISIRVYEGLKNKANIMEDDHLNNRVTHSL